MATNIKNSRSAIIVIMSALLICSLSSAAWTFQQPKRTPTSEDERKRALDQITKQLQSAQAEALFAQAPQAAPVQTTPAPAPPPAPAPAPAAPAPGRESRKVKLSFENYDLYDFINQITDLIELKPIIIDPDVKGTVNLNSGDIPRDDIMPLFNLILKNNNAALVQQGGTYQVVPISTALKRGLEIIEQLPSKSSDTPAKTPDPSEQQRTSKAPPSPVREPAGSAQPSAKASAAPAQGSSVAGSRMATYVIRAEFVPVRDLVEPIRLFMTTDGGVVMIYDRLNMLILTDYPDNVARITQIVRMLDNNYLDPDLVELVKINYNASSDVADDLKKMFGSGSKDSATGVNFISLDRLNAIFVMASSKRALEEVKGWIKALDSASSKNIQTFVYVVENSTASSIAAMLSALYGGEEISGGSSSTTTTTSGGAVGGTGFPGRSAQGAQGAQGTFGAGTMGSGASGPFASQSGYQGGQMGGYGGYGGYGAFGAGRQLGPQLNTTRTITSQVLKGGQFTGLQDTVRLVVDDVNNSLIIQATPADYAYISETIRKMDILPRQALIDARIYEVDLNDNFSFGINATLDAKGNDSTLTTGSLTDGLLNAKTFVPVGDARQIMAALSALAGKTKVRVLEAPSVLALDGQQAQIIVGAEVPYPGTSFTPSVGGSTTSVQYRDTGISLIVIPRISASGSVTMEIAQEVSTPGPSVSIGEGDAPSFNKTSVQTVLSVKDGETVAIAGLIRDGHDFTRTGVPFLSDIPLVGYLFGKTEKTSHRNELIILITPHVIRTPEKLEEMTQELRDSLRNVRKYADEKEKELAGDMEDAREDRYNQEQKALKKVKAPKPESQPAKSNAAPAVEKPKQSK